MLLFMRSFFLSLLAAPALAALVACSVRDASEPGNLVAKTVDEDPQIPALDVNGTRLHVESFGPAGAPIILTLHGGPASDYRYMLPLADATVPGSLVADHRLVFWDQRSTGLSRRHPESSLSMEQYFADLEALVDELAPDGGQVTLLGHSWGAAYATWYIAHHPERVRAAVLVEAEAFTHDLYVAHGSPSAAVDPFAEWIADPLMAREIVSPDDHARADLFMTSVELGTDLPRFHNHAVAPLFRPGCAAFKALNYQWFYNHDYDFTQGLDAYQGRVRFLGGTADDVLGYEFQKQQVGFFKNAELLPLDGDGHNDTVMGSAPRTIALVRSFLTIVEGAKR
jgi:proline iminopeptidase